MSDKPAGFTERLLNTILRYAGDIESSLKHNNYIAALCAIDLLIENLQNIRYVIKDAAKAQENNEEFDIICDSTPPMPPEEKPEEKPLGQFPSLYSKPNHGPS